VLLLLSILHVWCFSMAVVSAADPLRVLAAAGSLGMVVGLAGCVSPGWVRALLLRTAWHVWAGRIPAWLPLLARDGEGPFTGRLSRRLALGLALGCLAGALFFFPAWGLIAVLASLPGLRIPWFGGPLVFLAYAALWLSLWHRWLLVYGCDVPARLLWMGRLLTGGLVRLIALFRAGTKPKTDPQL
jgi:hypothetical protein